MRLRARLRIVVGSGTIRAEARRGGVVAWAAEAGYEGVGELGERLAELVSVEEMPPVEPGIEVRLLAPLAQVRLLEDLPRVNEAGLAGILAHQPQRFFRKNGKPLVTDVMRTGSPFHRRTSPAVVAAAVEAPVVEAIVAGARAAGFRVAELGPEHPAALRLSLFPGIERGERRRARLRRLAWLGGMAAALWITLGAGLAIRQRRNLAVVDAELATLGAPIQALLAVRARSDDARRMTLAVQGDDRSGAQLGRLLLELARALPDSAFLVSVALRDDGSGVLTGAARRPAEVVVAFERSGLVVQPKLEGQGVREVIGGREMERFTLVFGKGSQR